MKNALFILIIVGGMLAGAYFLFAGKGAAPTSPYGSGTTSETPAPPPQPSSGVQTNTSQPAAVIMMHDDGYEPSHVTVQHGQTVQFVNASSSDRWPASNIHPTHEIYPEFDPKHPIPPGASWSFQFDKIGEWRCHDHLMPSISCVITVQ